MRSRRTLEEGAMPKDEAADRIDYLFAAPEARFDRWRDVVKSAQQCAAGNAGARDACAKLVAAMLPYEDFFAYPGPRLVGILKERLASGDMIGEVALAIEMGADEVDIGKTIHPHPTLGESIGMAAEIAHGTCTDVPPQRK
jgi:hypothetical protein